MLPALLTTFLWALGAVASHRLARRMGSLPANFWRLLAAALFLGAYAHTFGVGFAGQGAGWFFLSGVVGFGFGDIALYFALVKLGPRLTALLVQCLAAPIAFCVEWAWLDRTPTGAQMLASAVILAGVGVALAPGSHSVPRGHLVGGILLGVIGAAGQGVGAVLSGHAFEITRAAGEAVNGVDAAYQRIWGGVLIAAVWLAVAVARRQTDWVRPRAAEARAAADAWTSRVPVWGWVVITALTGPVLGVSCYQWALSTAPSAVVLAVVATTPLAVMPVLYVLDGEKPGLRAALGGVVAVAGVVALALV